MNRLGKAAGNASDTPLRRLAAVALLARQEEARRREAVDFAAYDEIFQRMASGVRETQKRLARERRHAQAQRAVLERHPQARRLVMIRNDRRLQSWGLYHVFLERFRALRGGDAKTAAELAELALAVAKCLDPETHGEERTADFRGGALAALAEAKRRLSDPRGAWEAFAAAREELQTGTGDPLERAELEILRARLLHDFGPQDEAGEAFRRAGNLLRRIGDRRPERDLLDDTADGVRHRRAQG